MTYLAAVPMAGIGAGCGFFARGNMKVAGLVLNLLALVPAIILSVLMLLGIGAGALAPQTVGKAAQVQGGFEGIMQKAQQEAQKQMDEAARQMEEQQKGMELQIDEGKKAIESPPPKKNNP